ncbi:MAG: GntR family transcriptional regulator [Treponema sp.]|jgi:DNA-binding LacI/PurR family transcriptional regulator|nr:GntR family transcriptional regulator [Treponema sp.]
MESIIDRTGKEPVFKQIYAILVSEIDSGVYGESRKLPSEKEFCARFDVERNTVRKALQMLVDEARIFRVPGIGSFILPASEEDGAACPGRVQANSALRGAGSIVLLITQVDYLHSAGGESFHYKLIHTFEKRLSLLGYNMLFKPVYQDGALTDTIRGASPGGIIFDSCNQDAYYAEASRFGLPCVSVNHYTPLFTSVVSDNFNGAYRVAERLTQTGHRRIAFVIGKSSHQTTVERLNGIRSLYARMGFSIKNECLFPSDWTFKSGAEAARTILGMKKKDRPTAVFAFNDDLAYGCYSVFKSQGLAVPEDISIVGFDKSDRYTQMFPPVSTVDVNMDAIVDYACWYLSDRISRQAPRTCARIQIDTAFCDNGTIKNMS